MKSDRRSRHRAGTIRGLRLLMKRDPQVARLWGGDASAFQSNADAHAALCAALLNVTRGDRAVADLLFRHSGLFDKAWDRKASSDARTYGEATTEAAVRRREAMLGIGQRSAGYNASGTAPAGGTIRLDRVRPEPIAWLWPGRLFLREVILFVGEPAIGKSILTTAIAARTTTGTPWPDKADNVAGGVIFVGSEDSLATTVLPRFSASGGRLRRAHHHFGTGSRSADHELAGLEEVVRETGGVRLIIVDPITSFAGIDINSEPKVRHLLTGLKRLAERNSLTVIGVLHLNKSTRAGAMQRMLGSVGFGAVPRAVYFVGADPDDGAARLMVAQKFSLGQRPPGVKFAIESSERNTSVGRVKFLAWDVATTADEMLRGAAVGRPEGSNQRAERFLREYLKDGPVRQSQLKEHAEQEGIAFSTIQRVKRRIAVRSFHPESDRVNWYWELPHAHRSGSASSPRSRGHRPHARAP